MILEIQHGGRCSDSQEILLAQTNVRCKCRAQSLRDRHGSSSHLLGLSAVLQLRSTKTGRRRAIQVEITPTTISHKKQQ